MSRNSRKAKLPATYDQLQKQREALEVILANRSSGCGSDKLQPLSIEDRVYLLQIIYDTTLMWVTECAATKGGSGTGAATLLLERARLEMEALRKNHDGVDELIVRFRDFPGSKEAE